jgi:predicted ATPase/DNA-binding CsgD family transcriptional regulator
MLEGSRLVTLTGVGGVGKSRLALQVAQQLQRGFGDGVWLVELAPVADPELVGSAVAGVLGVADRSASSALSALVGYLEDKRLLLVLDNCEHLIAACAVLVGKLLAAAPGLRVLATSRQPLWVEGEQLVSVAPLSVPDLEALPPGYLSEFEAVRLFVERARAVQPGFAVTADNRVAVAGVCQRLDGIPLAIELAAARVRVLSVKQILARLDDRFRLLTTGPRVAPVRHRTLAAALDWSYGLCSAAEQALWARGSVFAGGFDLEAAEAVCAGDEVDRGEVFELVAGLVDKSILVREDRVGAAARYGLLETVRQYGMDRLAATGQEAALRGRHREYYRQLARRAEAERVSPREVEWLLRLRRELPDLRQAMESGLAEPGSASAALEIAVAVRDLWIGTGRYREGLRWLTRARALNPQPTPVRAVALAEAGQLALQLGDVESSTPMLAEAQTLAERLRDPAVHAAVSYAIGTAALLTQPPDLARALALTVQALIEARAVGDLRRVSLNLLSLATIGAVLGDPGAAGHAQECQALGETHGAEWTKAWGQAMLGLLRWHQGDREQPASLVRAALPIQGLVGDSFGAGGCLALLAWTAAESGQHQHAARLLGACQAIKRRDGLALVDVPPFADSHAQCDRDARRALGDRAYTAAFDHGSHFTLDEAVRYAVGETGGKATVPAARPEQPGRGPLTRREQQIAALVAQGLSNKDIAARLVISQRTAESHVEHILTKLGFTTRTQIATWITERDRAEGAPPAQ